MQRSHTHTAVCFSSRALLIIMITSNAPQFMEYFLVANKLIHITCNIRSIGSSSCFCTFQPTSGGWFVSGIFCRHCPHNVYYDCCSLACTFFFRSKIVTICIWMTMMKMKATGHADKKETKQSHRWQCTLNFMFDRLVFIADNVIFGANKRILTFTDKFLRYQDEQQRKFGLVS